MSRHALVWLAVLAAGAVSFAIKLAGHLVPTRWLAEERVARTAQLVTVSLLAALVAVQTFTSGTALVLDARIPALAAAALALVLRAPFVVVVAVAAVTAAVLRAFGMP
ncbi:AzlD domain-containing protein [Cellulomonas sp. P22]|uniref:AzlD domain-containing protein n=1 Tax=Cellulomonas sp. P22 TaxID=3373189 RepID=UPI0037B94A48